MEWISGLNPLKWKHCFTQFKRKKECPWNKLLAISATVFFFFFFCLRVCVQGCFHPVCSDSISQNNSRMCECLVRRSQRSVKGGALPESCPPRVVFHSPPPAGPHCTSAGAGLWDSRRFPEQHISSAVAHGLTVTQCFCPLHWSEWPYGFAVAGGRKRSLPAGVRDYLHSLLTTHFMVWNFTWF